MKVTLAGYVGEHSDSGSVAPTALGVFEGQSSDQVEKEMAEWGKQFTYVAFLEVLDE